MKFWYFFLNKSKFTLLILFSLIFAGFFSLFQLPKEANPEITLPIGFVTTVYPGASAKDVERLVTDEIEDEIDGLEDLDNYTSTSTEGVSSIIVNFEASADIDDRVQALRDAVSTAEPKLPDDANQPIVNKMDFSQDPVLILGLAIDVSEAELKRVAEDFQDEIESVPGISEAIISGARDQEILINIDKRKLDQFSVSIGELVGTISAANITLPIGSIKTDGIRYTVRLDSEIVDPDLIGDLPIKGVEGVPIYIRDLADVEFGLAESKSMSRVSQQGDPSISAVTIVVRKKSGGDITKIVDEVQEKIEALRVSTYPDAQVIVTWDAAKEISKSLGQLSKNGVTTIIIIAALLFLLLGRREALLAGLSIPFTFLIGFIGLLLLDSSINFLSLFSLILALGIVVDNGIVITEGLHNHISRGVTPREAAKKTIDEFSWPLISGTLTTVSVFVPMMFMSGMMGQFIRHIPITVNLVLVGSLFTALAIMPLLGAKFFRKQEDKKKDTFKNRYVDPRIRRLHNWYERKLRALLDSKQQQKRFTYGILIAFVLSLSLPATGALKAIMFSDNDADFFFIDVEAPIGTTLEVTDAVTRLVEENLYGDPRIESFFVDVGRGNMFDQNSSNGAQVASFTINLYEDRQESTVEVLKDYRKKLAPITEAKVTVSQVPSGPPTGAPVLISFRGPELGELERLSSQAANILEEIPGAIDVDTSFDEAAFEFVIKVDREAAIRYGLSPMQIAQTVRTAVQGTDASSVRYQGEDIDVVVMQSLNPNSDLIDDRTVTTIDEIKQMVLTSPRGDEVSLDALVSINLQPGTNSIRHVDGLREAAATAEVEGITPGEVFEKFEPHLPELSIPAGYTIKLGGEAEDIDQSFRDLFQALYIGVLLIAAILLLQFNSYRQPFFILMTLPLALIGVLPGLMITGQDLSFPAFIGIVALSGVVVNDAIILMDRINNNRRKGLEKKEAIINAGKARLQPILLTTITTIAGILPLTLSDPIWGALGFSIIFGLLMATILTLVVVPMMYLKWGESVIPE